MISSVKEHNEVKSNINLSRFCCLIFTDVNQNQFFVVELDLTHWAGL